MLSDVSLTLGAGEVLSVVGENGAGKSTLMKILAGVQPPDSGEMTLHGTPVKFSGPRDALESGVVLIHQELNLCDNLNVAENIFLGREPRRFGFLDSKKIYQESIAFLDRVGLNVSPKTIVKSLSIGKQQMVEIAKALSTQARVLIFDEPTSSLSAGETEKLFELIDELRRQQVGIIYISHRLSEVVRLSDRVLVLRDGKAVGELLKDQITHGHLVSMMVGRDITNDFSRVTNKFGRPLLEVDHLVTEAWPQESVSFRVYAGEIVGIAGLVGSGRTELLETLFGTRPKRSGAIRIDDQRTEIGHPRQAIASGLALVPEDRKQHGLIVDLNMRSNVGLVNLKRHQRPFGLINWSQQKTDSLATIDRLNVRPSSDSKLARFYSGGNQQKIVIGKWLTTNPKVLLLDEPTRGIDIGAKQEIYRLIERLARESMAILCVSSDLEEIIGLCDRVLVMQRGRITGELSRKDLTESSIMNLATSQ